MPSIQADDRPRRPMRCRHRTCGSVRAISRTRSAVPSGESSSTKMSSQATPSKQTCTCLTTSAILSISLYVGTMIDSSTMPLSLLSRGFVLRSDLHLGQSQCLQLLYIHEPRQRVKCERIVVQDFV